MANEVNLEQVLAPAWQKAGLELTARQYRKIASEGKAPAPIGGKVDALLALAKIAAYYQAMTRGKSSAQLTEARARKELANAEMAEINLKKAKGEIRETPEVVLDLSFLLANFKTHVRAWSKSLPPILLGREERDISITLGAEIDRLLTDLAAGTELIGKKKDIKNIKKKPGRPTKDKEKQSKNAK